MHRSIMQILHGKYPMTYMFPKGFVITIMYGSLPLSRLTWEVLIYFFNL